MTPDWQTQDGAVKLYLGDCLKIIPQIVPGSVDLCCDPPYGIGESRSGNGTRTCLAESKDYGDASWDDEPAVAEIIAARSISKWQVIFGGNYYELPPTKCWLVWDKLNGNTDFADCELAWTNLNKAVRRIQFRWHGMIRDEECERVHPCQKPISVMLWAINHIPKSERAIFDPMMGSGTTGLAAIRAGRRFIGIEREQEHFGNAVARIEQELARCPMFTTKTTFQSTQGTFLE